MWLLDRKYNHKIQIYNFIVTTKKKLRNKGRRFQAQGQLHKSGSD